MTNFSRNKILMLLVVILLVTNLGMLYFFTRVNSNKVDKSKNEKQIEWVKKELNLDSAQLTLYIQSRNIRDSAVKVQQANIRIAKMKMVELIKNQQLSDSAISVVINNLMDQQKPIEMAFFNHFKRVKALCNASQSLKYDTMLTRMVIRNTGGNPDKK